MALFEDFRIPHSQGNDFGKLLLRLAVGILLLLHGMAKINTPEIFQTAAPALEALNLPPETAWFALFGELLAPILLIIGAYTRFAGTVIAVQMALIMAIGHTDELSTFMPNGGYTLELDAIFMCAGLAISCLGSGIYALLQD